MRRKRGLVAGVAVVSCIVGLAVAGGSSAGAASGPIFSVMNTSETPPDGVWLRNSPHTGDTDRATGHGVYAGDQVQLQCYASGDAVGAYNNSLWYYVNNVTRPTVSSNGQANVGFLNAHYVNDGQAANIVDAGVGECGAAPPPAPTPNVSLAQGPAAPTGYRYAITLSGFAANAAAPISCRDSVSPAGFYNFSLNTDGSGNASTQDYCYSGDGPDHWVVAGGVESNHVSWGGGSSGGGGGTPGPSPTPPPPGGGGGSGNTRGASFYYSPYAHGKWDPVEAVDTTTLERNEWSQSLLGGFWCTKSANGYSNAVKKAAGTPIEDLAGWSAGRVGPIVYLYNDNVYQDQQLKYVLLIDPGTYGEFFGSWPYPAGCDVQMGAGVLLAAWLKTNPGARLVILSGDVTTDALHPRNRYANAGIQAAYFNDIRAAATGDNVRIRQQVTVCNYSMIGVNPRSNTSMTASHEAIYKAAQRYIGAAPITSCPSLPKFAKGSQWHP